MGSMSIPRPAALALLCAAVLLTRLPFLGAGYGLHADNWRTALAARHFAQTGVYEASRLPGYPVQDYVCALLWKTGPLGFNFLDAFFCTAAAFFFALICIEYGVADWWLAALALAFVPVLYVNSVSSKDFPWALAFLLASWWFALRKRPILTGILLGLAMGTRITSGAAALPIALILIDGAGNRAALRRVLAAGVIAAVICIGAFLPVYMRYGWSFLSFYANHAFPDWLGIVARMTVEVWGVLGMAGILLALAAAPFARARPSLSGRQSLAWASMLVIFAIAFICLPDEAAYLIPAVPFVLLLLWRAAPRWAFAACCLFVIASPFLSFSGFRPVAGLIVQDHRDRVATDASIGRLLQFTALATGSNAYIVGGWQPPIAVLTADAPPPNTKFLYQITEPDLDQMIAAGWHVWYLPNMRQFNYRDYHFDIAQHGARDIAQLRVPRPAPGGR